ncbi:MAG: hypothetical protein ACK5P5_13065 [Pseudobdellovibrionaceae bacterium]
MSLEKYLVDVLGIKNLFLDPDFITKQKEISQQSAEVPEQTFLRKIEEIKSSTAKTFFIIFQDTISDTECTMLQKMSEALNWKQHHETILFPESLATDMKLLLTEVTTDWLKQNNERKLILFTPEKDSSTANTLQPFIDIHHARICEQPKSISSNPGQKKLTWEKIKILKSSE